MINYSLKKLKIKRFSLLHAHNYMKIYEWFRYYYVEHDLCKTYLFHLAPVSPRFQELIRINFFWFTNKEAQIMQIFLVFTHSRTARKIGISRKSVRKYVISRIHALLFSFSRPHAEMLSLHARATDT